MKKLLPILLCSFVGLQTVSAQENLADTTWKFGGLTNLNFTQVYLNNWAAGGQQSLALTSLANLNLNYKKGNRSWINRLDLAYGVVQQGSEELRKTDDRIDFLSKYGRKASEHWYYTVLGNFKSQFAPGYNYPNDSVLISDFMSPGYISLSLGMDYRPSDIFSAYISPATAKITTVLNQDLADAGAFGMEEAEFDEAGEKTKNGENFLFEVGASTILILDLPVMENITYKSRLELFSSYTRDPSKIDVFWENILNMKVNKYISASITATLIYDDDVSIQETKPNGEPKLNEEGEPIIGPRTQFKEVLSIGFAYNFGDKIKK